MKILLLQILLFISITALATTPPSSPRPWHGHVIYDWGRDNHLSFESSDFGTELLLIEGNRRTELFDELLEITMTAENIIVKNSSQGSELLEFEVIFPRTITHKKFTVVFQPLGDYGLDFECSLNDDDDN